MWKLERWGRETHHEKKGERKKKKEVGNVVQNIKKNCDFNWNRTYVYDLLFRKNNVLWI